MCVCVSPYIVSSFATICLHFHVKVSCIPRRVFIVIIIYPTVTFGTSYQAHVCVCVCACEAQFVSLDMRFECCSDGACLFFVGMCYIHFNQEFIPTHSVINCSSRSRHI